MCGSGRVGQVVCRGDAVAGDAKRAFVGYVSDTRA